MKFAFFALALASLFASAPGSAQTQTSPKPPAPSHPQSRPHPFTPEGHWSGSLEAGDATLHLVLHVSKSSDGSFQATLDSLDQGVYGIAVSSLSLKNTTLKFSVDSVGATFEGKIFPDHWTIAGLWTQSAVSLPLVFHRQAAGAASHKPADAIASAEGVWQGALEGNGMRLRLQLHVTHDDKKQLVAALDSPDQGISGLPAVRVSQKDSLFHFEIPSVSGVFEGTVNAAKNSIDGTWTQSRVEEKLVFRRSGELLPLLRPQEPSKPYPYKEEEVSFPNPAAKITLAGTLTLPTGWSGPFPAAILIADSGPHNRDESLAGHRPFLVLADYLTRKGIAVLRYDKRGNGKSTGDFASATTEDLASDAAAAVAYLKTRKEIDTAKIGLIGHSEGGLIAPIVAVNAQPLAQSIDQPIALRIAQPVAWIVLLAGPGLKGEDVLLLQSELILRNAGVNDGEISRTLAFNKKTYTLVRQEKDPAALESQLTDLVESTSAAAALSPAALQSQLRLLVSPWFRYYLDYDPAPALQKVICPVLALTGEKDLQVPAKQNLAKIDQALKDGGNKDYQTLELLGLNHLLQHAPTGSPTEYGGIEETMAPEALSAISDWVLRHTSSADPKR